MAVETMSWTPPSVEKGCTALVTLRLPDSSLSLSPSDGILLYAVTKYDIESVVRTASLQGFSVTHRPDFRLRIDASGEVREYALLTFGAT
jgi:hypothetical protein